MQIFNVDFYPAINIEGYVDDLIAEKRPELPPECWNDAPVDNDKAWEELQRACGG
jgi:hypothetical protein